MDRTADEIARELREDRWGWECAKCEDINCFGCETKLRHDAADLLESKETENAALLARVEELQAKLAEAQRREQAAVEDMKVMTLAMRENEELSESCCFACLYDGQNLPDNVILAYGECPGYDRDDCFEWRGPQGAVEEME